MHHQVDRESAAHLAEHAQHLEATQVGAQQQAAAPWRQRGIERLAAVQAHLEISAVSAQHFDAVEQRAGEGMEMPIDLAESRGPSVHPAEKFARCRARKRREGDEVQADRGEQEAGGAVAERARDPSHEAQRA
jgi:hypothetical protein